MTNTTTITQGRFRLKDNDIHLSSLFMPILLGALFAVCWYKLWAISFLVLFIPVWILWSTRFKSTLFVLSFYLFANWEVIPAVEKFFDLKHFGFLAAIGLWFAQAILYSLPWILLYTPRQNGKTLFNTLLRVMALIVLLTLPPLGYFVWLQPTASFGMLFPAMGWVGFFLGVCLVVLIVTTFCVNKKGWPVLGVLLILGVSFYSNCNYSSPKAPNNWEAINTYLGDAPSSLLAVPKRESSLIQLANHALNKNKKVILFPENIALDWLTGTQFQWAPVMQKAKKEHASIVLGAQEDLQNGSTDDAFLVFGNGIKGIEAYPARQPMPLGLWKPWEKETYNRHWGLPGKFKLQGQEVAYLICYEQIIPWPILSSFLKGPKPQVIISGANQWFAKLSGYRKQHNNMLSFARLFGVPTLTATNFDR